MALLVVLCRCSRESVSMKVRIFYDLLLTQGCWGPCRGKSSRHNTWGQKRRFLRFDITLEAADQMKVWTDEEPVPGEGMVAIRTTAKELCTSYMDPNQLRMVWG